MYETRWWLHVTQNPQRSRSILGHHLIPGTTKVELTRFINRARGRNCKCRPIKTSRKKNKERLEQSSRNNVNISFRQVELEDEIIEMLSDFELMWNVRRSSWLSKYWKKFNRAIPGGCQANALSDIPTGSKRTRDWKSWNSHNSVSKSYRADSDQMRSINNVHGYEQSFSTLLLWQQEIERFENESLLPDTTAGWVDEFATRGNSGYWQIRIDNKDRDKTAFTSYHGRYRLVPVSFWLRNAPSTLQRTIYVAVLAVRCQLSLIRAEEIVLFTHSATKHIGHLRHVLNLSRDAEASLEVKRCSFFVGTMVCLGHIFCSRRLQIALHTTDSIKGLRVAWKAFTLKPSVGLRNVFRRLELNFRKIASLFDNKN